MDHFTENSELASYLKKNTSSQSLEKGLEIFRLGNLERVSFEPRNNGVARYKVKSERGWDNYNVLVIDFLNGITHPQVSCSCPYDWGGLCKHRVAVLLDLDQRGLWHKPEVKPSVSDYFDMKDSSVMLKTLDDTYLRANVQERDWIKRHGVTRVHLLAADNGQAHTDVILKGEKFVQHFIKQENGQIQTSCSCGQHLSYPLCDHKLAALLKLRDQYGVYAFDRLRDLTAEKNALLAPYGYTLNDDLAGRFDFKVDENGHLTLIILDKSFRMPGELGRFWAENQPVFETRSKPLTATKFLTDVEPEQRRTLVYSITINGADQLPDVQLTPLTAQYNEAKNKLSYISRMEQMFFGSARDMADMPITTDQDNRILMLARNAFSLESAVAALRKQKMVQGQVWAWQFQRIGDFSVEQQASIMAYYGELWERLLPLLRDRKVVVTRDAQQRVNSLEWVEVEPQPLHLRFSLKMDDYFAILECYFEVNDELLLFAQTTPAGRWLRRFNGKIARLASVNDVRLLEQFGDEGKIKVRKDYLPGMLSDFVLPLAQHYTVEFDIDKEIETEDLSWQTGQVYLKEDEGHLLLVPVFIYGNNTADAPPVEFSNDGRRDRVHYDPQNDQILIQKRTPEKEREFLSWLEALHPEFQLQTGAQFYYLPFGDVLKNQWLFHFFDQTRAAEVPVFGFAELKRFKYNPNKPKMQMRASSGIDWFDMKVEVAFGDQFASLADIRKAVLNKQNYIQLSDGSIGMLPEEWLERYAKLFKFGEVKDDSLKVSKLHFNLIEQLSEDIDSEKILRELAEKKQKLLNFHEIKDVPSPSNVSATLRDYQHEGFKWLNFLDEFRWGGCLADDMGLGKTLQILSFLQELKNRNNGAHFGTSLIVMPTTLIFNWQAEIEKFTPGLTYYVHRGITRQRDAEIFSGYDLVLTTYGTLRSDIDFFKNIEFQYVILDESQAIKNAMSLTAKAVKLLTARNRIAMTGTPVENNTMDLYSQMEFLNPGLLGSSDFFRTEYANPIDKHRSETAARELRTLIYPFILKRTKEEVASDLPDKTETVLFCEMGSKQRRVYETFRDNYRAMIADKMEEVGKEKAAFLILEGLLKLRQICDSPALLSGDEDYGHDSTKLDEIVREIEENAGHHKILVFSQFLKMLDLVRQHLEKANIPYEYLDGQTADRAERVNRFQGNDSCRVFLMSLKAGGVGINLTEADYVYLIDPWWNPAVEQQAIDRTHRIGQQKKVFAYRMICKDTVEEKILELQNKKKDIARDLISTEQGMLKKLTRDDIIGLFS